VATAAERPPSSATTIVSATNTNAKLDAVVEPLNGTIAAPSRIAAIGPRAT